jgi:sugar (pentulose or hexulose) kinase
MEWPKRLFERLGLAGFNWPVVGSMQEAVGRVECDGRSLVCYPSLGDHQSALAGASLNYGELSLNIATGSQIALMTCTLKLGEYRTRPYFDGSFINTFTNIPAGRALDSWIRTLTQLASSGGNSLEDPWSHILRAVDKVDSTDLKVDLALFDSPVGDRGSISNIREGNLSIGDLFRAAFESMAENYRTLGERLSPEKAWERIVFSGGLARRVKILRTIISERLDTPYRICAESEDTLIGLLAVAQVVSGRSESVGETGAKRAPYQSPMPS